MKIGIIGLHGHQVADLRQRKLAHELEFLDNKAHDKHSVEGLCRRNDKVIVMAPVARYVKPYMDRKKCEIHLGSTSTILRLIAEWTKTDPPVKPFVKPTVPKPVAAPPKEEPKMETAVSSAEPVEDEVLEVTDGRASLQPRADAGNVHANDQVESAPLVSLATPGLNNPEIGDWIRVNRPTRGTRLIDFQDWRKRVMAAVDQCFVDSGAVLEVHFWNGYAKILRVPYGALPKHRIEDPELSHEHLPRTYKRRNLIPTPVRAPAAPPVVTGDLRLAHEPRNLEVATQASLRPMATCPPRLLVWIEVCAAAVGRGVDPIDAALAADQALVLFLERFGPTA